MTFRGYVHNGKIELIDDAALPEGADVEIRLIATSASDRALYERTIADRLRPFIGSARGLPDDASMRT